MQLDPFQSERPVRGDEQFFDIELDRNTVLLPAPTSEPVQFDLFSFEGAEKRLSTPKAEEYQEQSVQPRSTDPGRFRWYLRSRYSH